MRKNGIKKIKAKIKKDLKNFMKDESGVMSKENILKVGVGTIAALSMFSGVAKAGEQACSVPGFTGCTSDTDHQSYNLVQWEDQAGQKRIFPSHGHHCVHTSY